MQDSKIKTEMRKDVRAGKWNQLTGVERAQEIASDFLKRHPKIHAGLTAKQAEHLQHLAEEAIGEPPNWRVTLREDRGDKFTTVFDCVADDADDAEDKARQRYPNCEIGGACSLLQL